MLTAFSYTVIIVPVGSPDLPVIVVAPADRLPLLSVVTIGGVVKQLTVRAATALTQPPLTCATTFTTSLTDNTRLVKL